MYIYIFDVCFLTSGVRVHKPGGDIDVMAPLVISDAGVVNTFKTLLPKEIACKSGMFIIGENLPCNYQFCF